MREQRVRETGKSQMMYSVGDHLKEHTFYVQDMGIECKKEWEWLDRIFNLYRTLKTIMQDKIEECKAGSEESCSKIAYKISTQSLYEE